MALVEQSQRAKPVRVPAPTQVQERAREEAEVYLADHKRAQRRSVVRGLILIAMVVLLVSMARAGMGRVFPPNWWRP